jgi:hypothetical protein
LQYSHGLAPWRPEDGLTSTGVTDGLALALQQGDR